MFDSLTELIEKISLGEDATIEFKRTLPHRNSLADEIAAFANARGSVILIGVDDNAEIVGVDRQELDRAEKTCLHTPSKSQLLKASSTNGTSRPSGTACTSTIRADSI